MSRPSQEDRGTEAPEAGRGGPRLVAALYGEASSRWWRFAFRAAIPIILVIAIAFLVSAH